MVVFEPQNCFSNAIDCAALMYTVARKILAKYVAIDDFKVGIGIDFGEMLVLKTGIIKKHEEQSEYKSLVWVGDAANTASKLADLTNKFFHHYVYNLSYEDWGFEKRFVGYSDTPDTLAIPSLWKGKIPNYKREFVSKTSHISLSCEEFCKTTELVDNIWKYNGKRILTLSKENRNVSTSPILISGRVFNGYKKEDPESTYIAKFSEKKYPNSPFTDSGIFGGVLILPEIYKLKI